MFKIKFYCNVIGQEFDKRIYLTIVPILKGVFIK